MSIVIEKYSPDHESAHRDFVLATYGNRRKRMNPDYIKWKFGEDNNGTSPNFVLAVDKSNNEVVGQIGYIPCNLKIGPWIVPAQWAGNLMIRPEYRGKAIGSLLYRYGEERLFTIGSNPSPSAKKSMTRAGFKISESGSMFFFPSKIKTIIHKKGISLGKYIDNFTWPFKWIVPAYGNDLQEISFSDFLAVYDQLMVNDSQIRVVHDEAFWNWRGKSYKDYHTPSYFYGEQEVYCFVVRYMNDSIIIEDLVAANLKGYRKSIRAIIGLLKREKKSEILLIENNRKFYFALRMFGFLKYATPTSIIYSVEGCSEQIRHALQTTKFRYTLCDSDENL